MPRILAMFTVCMLSSMTFVGVATADNFQTNAADDALGRYVDATVGTPAAVEFLLHATNNDGQNGCNADFGEVTTTITFPAAVTASASTLTFTSCETAQTVWFTASAPGSYAVSLSTPSGGSGSFNTNPAKFTIRAAAAPDPEPEPADTTAPVIAPTADVTVEATGPSGATATYASPAWTDDVDGPGTATCSPASGSVFALGDTLVTCEASDAAGNAATPATFTVHVVDTTPPAIGAIADQALGATSGSGAPASWTTGATDIVDGVVSVTCDRASGSSFPLGTTTVTCNATDAAGNTASTGFDVTVSLQCDGPLGPISPGATFKLGSTIPVKCKLYGASAGVSDATITLTMRKLDDSASSAAATMSTSNADTGNRMRYSASDDQYIYNLGTKAMTKGTWEITMDLGGGQTRAFTIDLR